MHFSFMEKFGASVLIVMWLVWGTNMIGDLLLKEPAKANVLKIAGLPAGGAHEAAGPEKKEPENALALLAKADPKKGAKAFNKCKSCHTAEKGGKNRVGPNLWDIVGEDIGKGKGFNFSNALKSKGGKWTYENLDHWLKSPRSFAKGTKMTFAGLSKATERAEVIMYLRSLSDSPKPLP